MTIFFPHFYVVSAEESDSKIPSWIRQAFGFWYEGEISDDELLNAIQYLLDEKILSPQKSYFDFVIPEKSEDNFYSDVQDEMFDAIKIIQNDPILDAVARSALEEIPYAGTLLLNLYDNSKGSDAVKTQQILTLLKNYVVMDEQQLRLELEKLEENKNEILVNQNYLEQLVTDTSIIHGDVQELKKLAKEEIALTKLVLKHLGIETQIEPEREFEIPSDTIKQIEERDREIKQLKFKIEQLTNEKQQLDIDYSNKIANFRYYTGDFEQALSTNNLILNTKPNDLVTLNNQGVTLSKQGNFTQAINFYDEALALDSNYEPALKSKIVTLHNYGTFLSNQGNFTQAINFYDEALALDPNYEPAITGKSVTLSNYGVFLSKQGNFMQAINFYDEAFDLDPNNIQALINRGVALNNMGNYTESINSYYKALTLDPNNADALTHLKNTFSNLGINLLNKGNSREALHYFDQALDLDPDDERILELREDALERIEKN